MPTSYYKKNKSIDIYDLSEMTGQSVEELLKGFKEAEEDIKNGRVGDAEELIKELNKKAWDYIKLNKRGASN